MADFSENARRGIRNVIKCYYTGLCKEAFSRLWKGDGGKLSDTPLQANLVGARLEFVVG